MFERFTPPSRNVIVCAQDEARALGHAFIDSGHVLLGLLRVEEGIAAGALAEVGIVHDDVRTALVAQHGSAEPDTTGQIPFLPGAKRALDEACAAADAMNQHWIGTEHLLLGLAEVRPELAPAAAVVRRILSGN